MRRMATGFSLADESGGVNCDEEDDVATTARRWALIRARACAFARAQDAKSIRIVKTLRILKLGRLLKAVKLFRSFSLQFYHNFIFAHRSLL